MAVASGASERRMLYGAKSALDLALMFAVVAFLVWAAGRFNGQVDLTSAGVNSLSPRTLKLIQGLETDITITGLYSTALKEIRPFAEKHRNRVSDLLDLYETAGRARIATRMIDASVDAAAVTGLLKRLQEKPAYKDEAAPHAAALERYPEVQALIAELLTSEQAGFAKIRSEDPQAGQVREIAIIERNLQAIARLTQSTQRDVEALRAEAIPRYDQAVQVVRDYLTQTKQLLEDAGAWMRDSGAELETLSPQTRGFFENAATRYAETLGNIDALLNETQELKRPKLEEAYDQLRAGQVIVVESSDKIEVLPQIDVWPMRRDRNAPLPEDGDPREFAGEQSISSAMLRMTQTERTAVVFARFGGPSLLTPDFSQMNPMSRQLPEAPYSVLNSLLEKENFIVKEWDVQTSTTPPEVEDAVRTVYVVFTPAPPPPARPGQPPASLPMNDQQKQAVLDAVSASSMAIFLVDWSPGSMFGPASEYPYAEYLKETWGIAARTSHLVLRFRVSPWNAERFIPRNPNGDISHPEVEFTDHPISAPLKALPVGLRTAVPLEILTGDTPPPGVTVKAVAQTTDSEDLWAIANVSRMQTDFDQDRGTRRYPDDIQGPFPLALAAENEEGKRVVVVGSQPFVSNAVVNAGQPVIVGGSLVVAQLYPANTDLFINAAHWLTGNANRIAVGPRTGDVPRLDRLEDGPLLGFCKAFLVGIWPGVALLVGAGVWLVRRR